MKLCDRCPIAAGCCLDYLGKACEDARHEADPSLVPNNGELMYGLEPMALATFLSRMPRSMGPGEIHQWLMMEEPPKKKPATSKRPR